MPRFGRDQTKRQKVSFAHLDVEALLKSLDISYERREDELYAKCPNPEHTDSEPSWHIKALRDSVSGSSSLNGIFNCWSCGWSGNAAKLVMTLKSCSFVDALRYTNECGLEHEIPVEVDIDESDYDWMLRDEEPELLKQYEWKGKSIKTRPAQRDIASEQCMDYLDSRLIGAKYIKKFGIVEWRRARRVIVPITRNGKMISWVARSYNGSLPKTLTPLGAPKKWELFNYDHLNCSQDLVSIVEGWADVIRLDQVGKVNPLGLCGSKLGEYRADALSRFKKIDIYMDGDLAGEVLANEIVEWLGRGRIIRVCRFADGKDPADYKPSELSNFKLINWSEYRKGD